jgi:hypothetical protein
MKFVFRKLIWKQEEGMKLMRVTRSLSVMETKERGSSREMEKRILLLRKREKNLHANIVQKMAMMKTIVGNFILKEDPKCLSTKGSQRLLQPYNMIQVLIRVMKQRLQSWVIKVRVLLQVIVLQVTVISMKLDKKKKE